MSTADRATPAVLGYPDFTTVAGVHGGGSSHGKSMPVALTHALLTRRWQWRKKPADSCGGLATLAHVKTLIALACLIVGAWLAAFAWLPAIAHLPLPALIASWSLPLGVVVAVVGLLLLRRAPQKPAFGDGPLLSTLKEAGFRINPIPNGWQADGAWKGVPLKVRKSIGHEAGRFGRPWTIVVTLPGQPIDPWPFLPEEGLIVDHRDADFTVAMADLSRPERMHRLAERLNQLLGLRS